MVNWSCQCRGRVGATATQAGSADSKCQCQLSGHGSSCTGNLHFKLSFKLNVPLAVNDADYFCQPASDSESP